MPPSKRDPRPLRKQNSTNTFLRARHMGDDCNNVWFRLAPPKKRHENRSSHVYTSSDDYRQTPITYRSRKSHDSKDRSRDSKGRSGSRATVGTVGTVGTGSQGENDEARHRRKESRASATGYANQSSNAREKLPEINGGTTDLRKISWIE